MPFFSLRWESSFSISATVMGTTSPSTILAKAMTTVLRSTLSVLGIEKMYSKFSRPIHRWSPNIPLAGTKR